MMRAASLSRAGASGQASLTGERLVEARGLRRSFGRSEALRGADFDLDRGEVLALIGPNGAGKTTLLRIVAGLLRPSEGTLKFFGIEADRSRQEALARLGFLTHQPYLYEDLSGVENVSFFARLYGLPEPVAAARRALARVGIEDDRANQAVANLSRGLKQRVGLARALVHGPELLLFDEPFSGLDPDAVAALVSVLREHRAAGRTALVTTHDLEQARALADRVVMLHRGRIAFVAPTSGFAPGDLERRYAAVSSGGAA